MAIKFQDSLEVKGGSASKIYLEGAGGTGSSTILQAHNPDDGAGHGGGTAYLKSSGWGEAQLAVGSYRWTQAGGKMTVTGGVYYFNTGNVGIGTGSPSYKLDVNGTIRAQNFISVKGNSNSDISEYNNPDSTSVNLGTYLNQYAFIDLSSSATGGGWIDFSKADGGDYSGRLRYENSSDELQIFTSGRLTATIESNGTATGSWGHAKLYMSNRWGGGGSNYPTIGSQDGSAGSLIMLDNPHVPWSTENPAHSSYGGRAGLRLERSDKGSFWDVGLAGDFFHIYRNGSGELFRVAANGNVGINRVASSNESLSINSEEGFWTLASYQGGSLIGGIHTNGERFTIRDNRGEALLLDNPVEVSGSLTVNGSIAATGYNSVNWDTAYGWGNHADAGYLTSETDSQTLSFNNSNGELTISNGNTVDLDDRYFDATGRKKWYNISAASQQARRYRIARVYYCPQHWDDTWQNIEFELLEEGYNASYVRYSLFGYYNGSTNQTLNLKVTDFRGLNSDTQRYNMFLGDHIDAGWEHSGRPVFFTDVFVDISYYKSLKITADTFGHTYQNTDPSSGAGITVFYDNPDVIDIEYTNVAKTNTYVGNDSMLWNTSNFAQSDVNNWNTAYGWGNHATAGYQPSGTYADGTTYQTYGTGNNGWLMPDYNGNTSNFMRMYYDDGSREFRMYSYHGGSGEAKIALYDGGVFNTLSSTNIAEFKTAYSWGNHASAGYLTSLPSHNHDGRYMYGAVANGGEFNDLTSPKNSDFVAFNAFDIEDAPDTSWYNGLVTTHSNYLSSYIINRHRSNDWYLSWRDNSTTPSANWSRIWHSNDFSAANVNNWNTAYGWGNHASAGYLTSVPSEYLTQTEGDARYLGISAKAADANLLDGINSTQFVRSDTNSVTIGRHLDASNTWSNSLRTLFLGWYGGKIVIGNNNDGGHDYAYALGDNTIPIVNRSYFWKTAKFEEDIQIDGNVNFLAGVGTWIASDVMTDSIGWNTNHGVYIGSNVGGTHYLRGNGKFTTGGSTYDLWHEGNFDPATKETAGAAAAVEIALNTRIEEEVFPAIDTKANVSHTHSAADITSGTLDGARLPWASNDGFTGTYPLVWKADDRPYTASWLSIRGSDDTLFTRSISANGKLSVGNGMWVNGNNATVYNNYNENLRLPPAGNDVSVIAFRATGEGGVPSSSVLGYSDRHETRIGGTWRQRIYAGSTQINNNLDVNGSVAINGSTLVDSNKRNIYLNSFDNGGGAGIFFRGGFSYNASITAEDHNGSSADGICISGYDGISFSTGSNEKNEVVRITGGSSGIGRVGIGTPSPAQKLHIEGGAARVTGGTSNGKYADIYVNDSWAYFTTNLGKYYFNAELRVDGGQIGSYNESLSLRTSGSTKVIIEDGTGHMLPANDRIQFLGLETNRWQIVFCETLDSAGQHESNLQDEEMPISQYATGTVLSWKNGNNRPCTEYADHMRMGIAVEGQNSPLIQGAEPVLVTGPVEEGDYLVTSKKEGHAIAIPRNIVKEQMLFDCVIGKALESGEGESHLIKTWINI